MEVSGLRHDRQSMCSLSNRTTLFEPLIYQGMADKYLMLTYFENILPKLPLNSMVVMDNASWHKSKELQNLFDKYKVELKFQPPYSPDTNPIENIWGNIKKDVRNYFDITKSLVDNLCDVVASKSELLESWVVG
jgi:transposase